MSSSTKLIHERRSAAPLGWRSRWKLEASLWAGVAVIVWESFPPLRPHLGPDAAFLAEWIALGLASAAAITAVQVKRRLNRRLAAEAEAAKTPKAPNPLSLIELLREHGVREFGSMYLYMPVPRRARHKAAWTWLETLAKAGLTKGEPWRIKAPHVKETVRQSHAHLFEGEPTHFEVHRLDWRTLTDLMGEELP
jgi:hypothetical protein